MDPSALVEETQLRQPKVTQGALPTRDLGAEDEHLGF